MLSLSNIETAAKNLADRRSVLTALVSAVQREFAAVQARHMPQIRKLVSSAAESEANLKALIESAPTLFEKPRTVIFHGIKCGYRKQKGKIEIDDPKRTVELIETVFEDNQDLIDLLLHIEVTPVKEAIADLPVSDAKKIGVRIVDDQDVVVVAPVDGEVDKIVTALLAAATADKN